MADVERMGGDLFPRRGVIEEVGTKPQDPTVGGTEGELPIGHEVTPPATPLERVGLVGIVGGLRREDIFASAYLVGVYGWQNITDRPGGAEPPFVHVERDHPSNPECLSGTVG